MAVYLSVQFFVTNSTVQSDSSSEEEERDEWQGGENWSESEATEPKR